MATADDISMSKIYLDMIEENNKYSFNDVMAEAVKQALIGQRFPFELVGNISNEDKELEYLTYRNALIDEEQASNIAKAYLNNTIRVVWAGKPDLVLKKELDKIRNMVTAKYKEVRNRYVQ